MLDVSYRKRKILTFHQKMFEQYNYSVITTRLSILRHKYSSNNVYFIFDNTAQKPEVQYLLNISKHDFGSKLETKQQEAQLSLPIIT